MVNKFSVLFICLGNICRSPMAQAVFESMVSELKLEDNFDIIDSCGEVSYHKGEMPDSCVLQTLEKFDQEFVERIQKEYEGKWNHRSRPFYNGDFAKFSYILVMDEANMEFILRRAKEWKNKALPHIKYFGEYAMYPYSSKIVADPYYGTILDFETVYHQCVEFSFGFLLHLFPDLCTSSNLPERYKEKLAKRKAVSKSNLY